MSKGIVALASDHAGLPLKREIMTFLDELEQPYRDYGCIDGASSDYPKFAVKAARAVADGTCRHALLFCGTGQGVGIAANKVKGIRCAVCSDTFSAGMSRAHNDANALALGARVVGTGVAREIVRVFLNTEFDTDNPRHKRRVDMIGDYEKETDV
jgi:ribose 5-phosphate isomerase B